jgi:hypothetical protein
MMRTRLRAFHDGSLAGAARATLERHLDGCRQCAGELRALEETDALLSRCRTPAPVLDPADAQELFRSALVASGVTPITGRRMGVWRWRFAGAVVLLALGASASGLVGRSQAARSGAGVVAQIAPDETVLIATDEPVVLAPLQEAARLPVRRLVATRRVRRHRRPARCSQALVAASAPVRSPDDTPAPQIWEEADEPTLFVAVQRPPVVIQVALTQSGTETPGYAQAMSIRYEPDGGQVVTRATASSCAPEMEHEALEEMCGALPAPLELMHEEKQEGSDAKD